jgi:acyl-CoA synthetase (AMP-forming)/AMP-acid ligase II
MSRTQPSTAADVEVSPSFGDPLSYLEFNAAVRSSAGAVYDLGEELSFGRLLDAVHSLMADLRERGVAPGDVVAVALPNVWRYVALEIAIPALNAILLPIPIRSGRREVQSALERSGAVLVIADESDAGNLVAESARRIESVRAVIDAAELDVDHARAPRESAKARELDPDRTVQIALTSGTTGPPKLAALTARLKQLTFEGFTSRLGIAPGDRVLPMSPITQGVGEMCLYALRTGATMVMAHEPHFDAERAVALTERSRATILCGVPTMIGRLLHSPSLADADLRCLRATISAGSALPPAVAQAWESRSDSRTCSFYGAMDIGQLAVSRPEDPAEKRWATVGRPHDRAELLVCDATGQPVATGDVGEICMRGPLVQQRYWGEPDGPFASDGWAHFGDLGFVDEDGYLHITGRLKDTIIRGGNNINPLEVEELVRRCPGVMDVCVIGRPDPDLGERTVAFVVADPGARPALDDVLTFLERQGLTRFKWPESVVIIDALPTGSTGKVDRAALRKRVADENGG